MILSVPWPLVIAASPETFQRKVRSALTAGGTDRETVAAVAAGVPAGVAAAVAGAVMTPASVAEIAVTLVVAVVVIPLAVMATLRETVPAASAT